MTWIFLIVKLAPSVVGCQFPFISAHELSQETWPMSSEKYIWQSRVELRMETWVRGTGSETLK